MKDMAIVYIIPLIMSVLIEYSTGSLTSCHCICKAVKLSNKYDRLGKRKMDNRRSDGRIKGM